MALFLGGKPASAFLSQVSVLGQGCGPMAENLLSMPKAWLEFAHNR